jgi:hypothetical protein
MEGETRNGHVERLSLSPLCLETTLCQRVYVYVYVYMYLYTRTRPRPAAATLASRDSKKAFHSSANESLTSDIAGRRNRPVPIAPVCACPGFPGRPTQIETRSFQTQINPSQSIVQPAIRLPGPPGQARASPCAYPPAGRPAGGYPPTAG